MDKVFLINPCFKLFPSDEIHAMLRPTNNNDYKVQLNYSTKTTIEKHDYTSILSPSYTVLETFFQIQISC